MKEVAELFHMINTMNAPDFTIIGYYWGHIGTIEVNVHPGGWIEGVSGKTISGTPEDAMRELVQTYKEFRAK